MGPWTFPGYLHAREGKTTSGEAQPPWEICLPLACPVAALPTDLPPVPSFPLRCAYEGSCWGGGKGVDMLKDPPGKSVPPVFDVEPSTWHVLSRCVMNSPLGDGAPPSLPGRDPLPLQASKD